MSKEVINSSLTPTCQHTIHQHLGTMKTSHIVEERRKAIDLERITSMPMLSPGSKNNSSRGKIEGSIRVRKGLNPLKIRCFISCQKTKGFEST